MWGSQAGGLGNRCLGPVTYLRYSRGLISWSSGEWFGVEGRKGALVLIDKSSVCWQTSA
jgi:hypothetical protein